MRSRFVIRGNFQILILHHEFIQNQPLARLGANVTGVDASKTSIEVAKQHMLRDPALSSGLQYQHSTAGYL